MEYRGGGGKIYPPPRISRYSSSPAGLNQNLSLKKRIEKLTDTTNERNEIQQVLKLYSSMQDVSKKTLFCVLENLSWLKSMENYQLIDID